MSTIEDVTGATSSVRKVWAGILRGTAAVNRAVRLCIRLFLFSLRVLWDEASSEFSLWGCCKTTLLFFPVTVPWYLFKMIRAIPSFLLGLYLELREFAVPRMGELVHEFPSVVKGLSQFWTPPFDAKMVKMFYYNVAIFSCEVLIAWVASRVQKVLFNTDGWSYIELLGLLFVYLLVLRVIFEIFLPYRRERFNARHFKYHFITHVALTCVRRAYTQGLSTLTPDRMPAVMAGAEAAFDTTQLILRESLVGIRGVCILVWMSASYPLLAVVAVVCMCIDLVIILHMDARVWKLQRTAENTLYKAWGSVGIALDDTAAASRSVDQQAESLAICEKRFEAFIQANAERDVVKLRYEEFVRNGFDQIVDMLSYSILLIWVLRGDIDAATLFFMISQLNRAQGPFSCVYNTQQTLMKHRPAYLRLGELCQIDFGIKPPREIK